MKQNVLPINYRKRCAFGSKTSVENDPNQIKDYTTKCIQRDKRTIKQNNLNYDEYGQG